MINSHFLGDDGAYLQKQITTKTSEEKTLGNNYKGLY
jgi:hypothetical protein